MDYDLHGHGYAARRRPDARIASRIHAALCDARTVVNVGAGSGSYEPGDRYVLAFEPSQVMRAQRSAGMAPAISACAESLPLDDDSVDAAMAILTIHHWTDQIAGLTELRRVARGPVAVLTIDVTMLPRFWLLADYVPEAIELTAVAFPRLNLSPSRSLALLAWNRSRFLQTAATDSWRPIGRGPKRFLMLISVQLKPPGEACRQEQNHGRSAGWQRILLTAHGTSGTAISANSLRMMRGWY